MHVSKSLYNDLKRANESKRQSKLLVTIVKLTKAGVPSKGHFDTHHYATVADAELNIAYWRKLNPSLTLNYQITDSTSGEPIVSLNLQEKK